MPVDDLVVTAEFRDTIYPGLQSTGKVERAPGKPFHTVINGENFHVLEALTFTHRAKIDAIYIDPPYNSGAKDWKYNNAYVDKDDIYRHSKWLAMMERRLNVAKTLLNPEDSVLIVTIDEKEYLRLGLLLEQVFPDADLQMVTALVNEHGATRQHAFTRVDEYIYTCRFGRSKVASVPLSGQLVPSGGTRRVSWHSLKRAGNNRRRKDRANLFYPIWVTASGELHSVGASIALDVERSSVSAPSSGVTAIWPIATDGSEGNWQHSPESLRKLFDDGMARIRPYMGRFAVTYLKRGDKKKIKSGEIIVRGKDVSGALDLEYRDADSPAKRPRTIWTDPAHDAGNYGTSMLGALIPGRHFPYPKSLYVVEDTLRFFVHDKPDAIILDFFAGSGTTAHAIMRLNRQDGGNRQTISVTNNAVSVGERKALRESQLRPGDEEWERQGIFEHITKPRIEAAVTGISASGKPIGGDYEFTDEFAMSEGFAENVEFFNLTYESPVAISHNLAFQRIAPLLWMRAGSVGRRIESIPKKGWEIADAYAILEVLDRAGDFCDAVLQAPGVRVAYIFTEDAGRFQSVASRLPGHLEVAQLQESYLANFRFQMGASV